MRKNVLNRVGQGMPTNDYSDLGTLDDLKVRQAVMENEYMSTNGPVKYNEKGIALFPLGNLQWRAGKQVLLYPLDRAKVKGIPMKPWDQR